MTPTLQIIETTVTLTYPAGEPVECESLSVAERFLDWLEARQASL